ncbi:hypothetical protein [Rosistilla oblonga]|uniref:hypothetical protein n=1 Tax=Rosistilla oblonga TaxID=2527990 RepID=UPI003A980507
MKSRQLIFSNAERQKYISNGCDLSRLQVGTTHFSPAGYEAQAKTFEIWKPTLGPLADKLTCMEMVLDGKRREIPGSIVIRGTARNAVWQKEPLTNLFIRNLDPQTEFVGLFDHDMTPVDPDCYAKALELLKAGYCGVQLFRDVRYLNPDGVTTEAKQFGVTAYPERGPGTNPGGSWMFRRDWLDEIGGISCDSPFGGGDRVLGVLVNGYTDFLLEYSPGCRDAVNDWVRNAEKTKPSFTFVDSEMLHWWHGSMFHRLYMERQRLFMKHNVTPGRDYYVNGRGLLEFAGNKPELQRDVLAYFRGRREDG